MDGSGFADAAVRGWIATMVIAFAIGVVVGWGLCFLVSKIWG